MRTVLRLLIFTLVLAIMAPWNSTAAEPVILQEHVDKYPLARHLSLLVDKENRLGIEDILKKDIQEQFKPNTEGRENFGQTPFPFWFKFSLENPSDHNREVILELAFPHIDYFDVYVFDKGRRIEMFKTGDLYPYEQREIDYRNFLFKITAPAHKTLDVYLRSQTRGGEQLPLTIWTQDALLTKINKEQTFLGAYFGILGAMILYNLFLFIFLDDRTYLYYVLFVASMFLQQLGLSRMDMEYLWPNLPGFANTSHFVSYCLSFFFAAVFCRSFLNTRKNAAFLDKILLGMMGLCVLAALIIIPGYYRIGIILIMYIIAAFEPLLLLAAGVVCWLRGQKTARYYTLAWTVLVITAVINNFRSMGIIEPTFLAYYASHIGSALEAVLLSIALADRINAIRNETIDAKQRAFEAERSLATELEKQVSQRTAELEEANRELEKQSNTDGLTGIFNRRYFDRQLSSQWSHHERKSLPLALIMADIDFFKLYNDAYGHQAGDACLKAIAQALESSVHRPLDVAARYGGEEFVILLPDTDANGAEKVARTITRAVRDLNITHEGSTAADGLASLSIGAASVVPEDEMNPSELISLADQALYKSKAAGRNRITVIGSRRGSDSE